MRVVILLVVLGLLAGCAVEEKAQVTEDEDMDIGSVMMRFPRQDVDDVIDNASEARQTTDLTTSENTFDAIDEAISELG